MQKLTKGQIYDVIEESLDEQFARPFLQEYDTEYYQESFQEALKDEGVYDNSLKFGDIGHRVNDIGLRIDVDLAIHTILIGIAVYYGGWKAIASNGKMIQELLDYIDYDIMITEDIEELLQLDSIEL